MSASKYLYSFFIQESVAFREKIEPSTAMMETKLGEGEENGVLRDSRKKHCTMCPESREREMNVHEASLIIAE